MKVEYLIIQNDDKNYCNSVESLEKLLTIDDKILSIKKNLLTFEYKEKSHEFEFNVTSGNIDSNDERYFKISISKKEESTSVDVLASLCREIKIIVQERLKSPKINTLWDDVGRDYAIKAYPLINEVENLMRKLISEFLYINVGKDFAKKHIHRDELSKIEAKANGKQKFIGELYLLDFIDLSNVLFKKYRDIELENVERIILKCKQANKIELQDIEGVIAKSNWERYFSNIIDFEEDQLAKKWGTLYHYRNHIAHNRFISLQTFNSIKELCEELKETLQESIEKIHLIEVPEEERESVINTIDQNLNETLIEYHLKRTNPLDATLYQNPHLESIQKKLGLNGLEKLNVANDVFKVQDVFRDKLNLPHGLEEVIKAQDKFNKMVDKSGFKTS